MKVILGFMGILLIIFMMNFTISYLLNEEVNLSPAEDCSDCLGFLSSLNKVYRPWNPIWSVKPSNIIRFDKIKDYFINPDLRMMKDDTQTFIVAFYNNEQNEFSLDYSIKKDGVISDDFEVELYNMEYANVTGYYYTSLGDNSPPGLYLDPLLSYQRNEIVNSAESVFWWVTLRSKEGTSAGGYRFEANVNVSGQIKNKGFDFIVYNYTMPRRSVLQFNLGLKFFEETEGYPGYMPLDYHHAQTNAEKQEVIDNYMSYLSKNKISAAIPYLDPMCQSCSYNYPGSFNLLVTNLTEDSIEINYTNFDKQMERYFDEGRMNTFSLGTTIEGFYRIHLPLVWLDGRTVVQDVSFEEYDRIMRLYWTNVSEHLRTRKWINYSIISLDEPFTGDRGETIIHNWNNFTRIFRENNAETKLGVYLGNAMVNDTNRPWINEINADFYSPVEYIPNYIWQSQLNSLDKINPRANLTPLINDLMDEDDEIGTYWTSNQHLHVDRPAIDNRIFGMKYWNENVTLLHHWNVLQFAYTNSTGDIVNNNTWRSISHRWGAGGSTLFYPPCKTGRCDTFTANITPSIRSELFREALEDYNALEEMEKLIKKAELNGIEAKKAKDIINKYRKLAQDYATWTNTPELTGTLATSTRNITYFEDLHRELYAEMDHLENNLFGCGNNLLNIGEQCDDGNLINGDGCSSSCVITPVYLVSSYPPNGAIDARIPHVSGNPAITYGWDSINLTFSGYTQNIVQNDFIITTVGGAIAPAITSISQSASQNQIVLNLDRQMSPGNRTIIEFNPSGAKICLGYLPGDVNGDSTTIPFDLSQIVDANNGIQFFPIYSTDLDRSGAFVPADINVESDIVVAGLYGSWNGRSLAACPCGNGVIDSGEQCDDGNFVNDDGCSDTCLSDCNTEADGILDGVCDRILTCDELDSFIDNYYINGVSINKVSEVVLEYLTNPVCS